MTIGSMVFLGVSKELDSIHSFSRRGGSYTRDDSFFNSLTVHVLGNESGVPCFLASIIPGSGKVFGVWVDQLGRKRNR